MVPQTGVITFVPNLTVVMGREEGKKKMKTKREDVKRRKGRREM
jgi:hypothetical protein